MFRFSTSQEGPTRPLPRPTSPQGGVVNKHVQLLAFVAVILGSFTAGGLHAHEIRPALLDITEREPGFFDVQWKVPALGDRSLPIRPVFPECMKPVGPPSAHAAPGAILQYFSFKTDGEPISGETITIDGLTGVQIDVLVRIKLANGDNHSIILRPSSPSCVIPERPSTTELGWSYFLIGIKHILEGVDHLLFILGLLLIVKSTSMLVKTVTAFTVAHSITLAIATLGYASTPLPPLNVLIALSILFLGPEIVRVWRGQSSFSIRHPWVVAFAFGLLHGFGFASGLKMIGLPAHEIVLALLMFNVGVEAGQLFFVGLIIAMLYAFRTLEIRWPRWAELTPGYAVGSLGAFWVIQRAVMMCTGA
jgi:hydrogenase/urease accessory protein HupE